MWVVQVIRSVTKFLATFILASLIAALLLTPAAYAKTYSIPVIVGEAVGTPDDEWVDSVEADYQYIYVGGGVSVGKLDVNGNVVWYKTVADPSTSKLVSVLVNGSYVYAVGQTDSGNGFIVKLDKNGNLKWTKTISGITPEYATTDGQYIYIIGYAVVSGYSLNIVVVKIDADGNVIWSETIGGVGDDYGEAIVSDGQYLYISGYTRESWTSDIDVFVAKLDTDGNLLWFRTLGLGDSEIGRGVATDGQYVYVGGDLDITPRGDSNIFVAEFDADGNLRWVKLIGGSDTDTFSFIYISPDHYIYVGGFTCSFMVSNVTDYSDAYLAKLDTSGDIVWLKVLGGDDDDELTGVALINQTLYAIGTTYNYSTGYADILISWNPEVWADFTSNVTVVDYTSVANITSPTPTVSPYTVTVSDSTQTITDITGNVTKAPISIQASIKVSQADPSKPVMTIDISGAGTYVYDARSAGTGLLSTSYGYVLTIKGKAVIYSPVSISSWTLSGNKLTITLSQKANISISATKNTIKKIIVDGTEVCSSPGECEALRDADGVIVIDPITIEVVFVAAKGRFLGGEADTLVDYKLASAALLATVIVLTLVATAPRKNWSDG
jgi:hypothetical protein